MTAKDDFQELVNHVISPTFNDFEVSESLELVAIKSELANNISVGNISEKKSLFDDGR